MEHCYSKQWNIAARIEGFLLRSPDPFAPGRGRGLARDRDSRFESGRTTRNEETLVAADVAAEYGNAQEDVLSLFDDIAREFVRIGHGVEENEGFIEASHSRRITAVALWGRRNLGTAP
jgi:hypothetical protein